MGSRNPWIDLQKLKKRYSDYGLFERKSEREGFCEIEGLNKQLQKALTYLFL